MLFVLEHTHWNINSSRNQHQSYPRISEHFEMETWLVSPADFSSVGRSVVLVLGGGGGGVHKAT